MPPAAAIAAGAVILLACAARASAVHAVPRRHDVAIQDFVFRPESLTVSKGDTVEWMNTDLFEHTATAKSGAFDSGALAKGARSRFIPSDSGSYAYRCTFHPTMEGVIIVR